MGSVCQSMAFVDRGGNNSKPLEGHKVGPDQFVVKDSGDHHAEASGMVRSSTAGKIDYETVFNGPMLDRWAIHLTKGAAVYPDQPDGTPNWMLANGEAELRRARKSALRHFRQWLRGDRDEDHAAAVYFNLNLAEYVRDKIQAKSV